MHYLRHILGVMLSATCLCRPCWRRKICLPEQGQSTQQTDQDKYDGNMLYQPEDRPYRCRNCR
jgi:hypothetical protein